MQPILAESAPHRGRAIAFAAVLAALAMVALFAIPSSRHHNTRYRGHHRLPGIGKCPHGYVYVAR
jgi:membrane protein YdbS with pleckstrin-like domain